MRSVIDILKNQQATPAPVESNAIVMPGQDPKNQFKIGQTVERTQPSLYEALTNHNKCGRVNGRFAFTNLYIESNKLQGNCKISCTKFGKKVSFIYLC